MAKGASAVWEIRPTAGSDTNGGGYDSTISGAGTDYTQQNSAQLTVTDLVGNGTTTLTSVTGGFTSAMIGNALYQNGDSNRYFITAVALSNSITVDRATGTFTGKTCNVGGALAGLVQAFSSAGGIASNTYWLKKSGILSLGSAGPSVTAGVAGSPTYLIGYNVTRGDIDNSTTFANHPEIQNDGVHSGQSLTINAYCVCKNIWVDGASFGASGFIVSSTYAVLDNCKSSTFTTNGFLVSGTSCVTRRCVGTGGTAAATAAFNDSGIKNTFVGDFASANACPGFVHSGGGTSWYVFSIADSNTGSSSDGFQDSGTTGNAMQLLCCVSSNNGRDGMRDTASGGFDAQMCMNCIFYGNTGYGVNSNSTNYTNSYATVLVDFNAFGSNTSGARNQVPAGSHDVTLTASPFVSSTDFNMNSTAGGGASCRATGFPGQIPTLANPGYADIGALQHQASGGGGLQTQRHLTGGIA